MVQYEMIKTILGLLPILFVFIVFIFVKDLKWSYRYPIVIILGWIVIFLSTILLSQYAIDYAPTQEIAEEAAMNDGAPVAFSYLFGWIYALFLMLIIDATNKTYLYLSKKYFQEIGSKK